MVFVLYLSQNDISSDRLSRNRVVDTRQLSLSGDGVSTTSMGVPKLKVHSLFITSWITSYVSRD